MFVKHNRGRDRLTNREPSNKLKHSSITTSSSFPRISESLRAIHLYVISWTYREYAGVVLLLHYFNIDLFHVNLLVELDRKLGLPQQLLIHWSCHFENRRTVEK